MIEACHKYNESWHTYDWAISVGVRLAVERSFVCVTWLIRMCDMTHSYVCHDSLLYHTCAMTHYWRWNAHTMRSVMNESWHTYEWVTSHIRMSHDTHMNESCHTYHVECYEWVMSHIWMSRGTHMNESWHTYEWGMSQIWMRPITRMNKSCYTNEWVMPHVWMSHVTYMNHICWWGLNE